MNFKKQLIPGLCFMILLLLPVFLLPSCGTAPILIGMDLLKNSNQPMNVSSRLPTPEIDTTETIINKHGKPQEMYNINEQGTKQIFVYYAGKSVNILAFVYNPEKKQMIYKQLATITQESYLKTKQKGTIKSATIKAFPFFQEPISTSTDSSPSPPPSPPSVLPASIPSKSFSR